MELVNKEMIYDFAEWCGLNYYPTTKGNWVPRYSSQIKAHPKTTAELFEIYESNKKANGAQS